MNNSLSLKLPFLGWRPPLKALREKPQFGYFKALFMSFYSVCFYVDVRHRWRGLGLNYLLLICCCFILPGLATHTATVYRAYRDIIYPSLQKLPPIVIKGGKFSYAQQQPLTVENPKDHSPLFVVDTINQHTKIADLRVKMLITEQGVWLNLAKPSQIDYTPWHHFDDGEFSRPALTLLTRFANAFFISLCPVLIGLFYGIAIGMYLTTGFLFQLFAKIVMKHIMTYTEAVRVSIVCSTPSIMLLGICMLTDIHYKVLSAMIPLGVLFFFIFAIRANKYSARLPVLR